MSILDKLTEGIVGRDLRKEGDALLNKWEKTGLLEGIGNDAKRQGMARLLENQAAQLLKEASTMSGGNVEGFASVAFPLVRRVFGGLLANDIVSVQPMSLPSGLIFFLDFTHNSTRLGADGDSSLYGGDVTGSQITGGVNITGLADSTDESFYNLNNGYASPTGSASITYVTHASGTFGGTWKGLGTAGDVVNNLGDRLCRYDADLTSGQTIVTVGKVAASSFSQLALDNLVSITVTSPLSGTQVRRLTQFSGTAQNDILFFFAADSNWASAAFKTDINMAAQATTWAQTDNLVASNAVGSVIGTTAWGLENDTGIPEIDIKVDSVAVTAVTKKLKAKWTPELGQDLNAYHNLDAEVELTSILSEQIALEIDREILEDLMV